MKYHLKKFIRKIASEFKKYNPIKTCLLWGIISIVMLAAIFVFGPFFELKLEYEFILAAILLFVVFLGRFYNVTVEGFTTVLTLIITAGALFYQSRVLSIQSNALKAQGEALKIQTETLNENQRISELTTRPQLSISITPRAFNSQESFFGGIIIFKNSGSSPAKNIKTEFLLTNDTNTSNDFRIWYKDTMGAFPDITFVPAKSKSDPIPLVPSIPKNANFASIGAFVTYEGPDSSKKYWHIIRKTFRLHWDNNRNLKKLILIENIESDEPGQKISDLKSPDWKSFPLGKIQN